MEIKLESAKFLYDGNQVIGFFKQNGTLKLFTAEEAQYSNLEQIFKSEKPV